MERAACEGVASADIGPLPSHRRPGRAIARGDPQNRGPIGQGGRLRGGGGASTASSRGCSEGCRRRGWVRRGPRARLDTVWKGDTDVGATEAATPERADPVSFTFISRGHPRSRRLDVPFDRGRSLRFLGRRSMPNPACLRTLQWSDKSGSE
jgi:hypothetical protein